VRASRNLAGREREALVITIRWREIALRLLFALGVAWGVWWLGLGAAVWEVGKSEAQRRLLDALILPFTVVIGLASTWLAVRRWPAFLVIPPAVSAPRVFGSIVLHFPIVFVLLAVLFGGAEWIHLRRTGDPTHSQYGLSVLWVVVTYPASLAPVVVALTSWWWFRRAAARLPGGRESERQRLQRRPD
jgi:hypothetical protein